MTKKSGIKYSIKKCSSCGENHSGYSGKIDSNGKEYVVCGNTNKRVNIEPLYHYTNTPVENVTIIGVINQ